MEMDASRFERICQDSKLTPVKKLRVGDRVVFIADGYLNYHPDFEGPHYKTLWAVGKDEDHLEVARPLYFAGIGMVSKDQRVAAAVQDGIAFARGMNVRLHSS